MMEWMLASGPFGCAIRPELAPAAVATAQARGGFPLRAGRSVGSAGFGQQGSKWPRGFNGRRERLRSRGALGVRLAEAARE